MMIARRAITFCCCVAFVGSIPLFNSSCLTAVSLTMTPYFFITSPEPVNAACRSRSASSSAMLLNDAKSIDRPVIVLLKFSAVDASKPNGTNRSCEPAMNDAICCLLRPTSPAKPSAHFLIADALSANTVLNLDMVSSMSEAALMAGINGAAIAEPMPSMRMPIVLAMELKARSLASIRFSPAPTRSRSETSTNAFPARTALPPAID